MIDLMEFDLNHTFVTSDHHFGSWKKTSYFRVFTKEQEDEAVKKWNSIVKDNDVVLYVGDFHDCTVRELIDYKRMLNGNIILIKGNHDVLPVDLYKGLFKDVVEELQVQDIWLRHVPYDDGRKQIYGHLHRGESKDPFMLKNGFCACASFHDGMLLLLNDILKKINKCSLTS